MKSILLSLILAPCLLWSCEHKCNETVLEAYCPAKSLETPLCEWDGHLWRCVMLQHHPDCGCDEMKEDQWPEYEKTDYELGN